VTSQQPSPAHEPGSEPRRRLFVDLTPLRASPAFRWLFIGNLIAGIGGQLTVVAVGLEIYALTASTFAVAMVGVIALVPMIVAGLYGGMLVDAFDRRRVLFVAATLAWGSTIGIAALAWTGAESVPALYALTALNAVAVTVTGTARSAILPRLVGTHLIASASALNGVVFGLMLTIGPALGGVLVATLGYAWTYTVDVALFIAAFAGILHLPAMPPEGERHAPGLESLRQGMAFLRRAPNVRMSFLVDIVAMTFGRPHALFPAVGALVLGGGAITVGSLTAALAVGVLLSSLVSGRVSTVRYQGAAIGWAIAVYGATIVLFGVSLAVPIALGTTGDDDTVIWPALIGALLAMAASGAADNISSIFRQTVLMTAAPDNMRGRLQGVFVVVVTGGPRLGDLYVGVVALAGALWFPPVLGGLLIIGIIGLMLRLHPTFRHYDAKNPAP
jgi:MFS family permease